MSPSVQTFQFSLQLYLNAFGYRSFRPESKIALKPRLHPVENGLHAARQERPLRAPNVHVAFCVQQQPDARGMDRIADHTDESADVLRHPQAHRHVEHFFRELDGAFHLGTAAGQHDAGGHRLLEARAAQFVANQREQFLVARLHDFGQGLAREPAGRPVAHARYLDGFIGVGELRQRTGILDLDVLGVLRGRAHGHRDVVRDLIARNGNHGGVPDRAAAEHRDIRGAAADVDHTHPEVLLILGEHRVARGQLFQHDVVDAETAALHALDDVLCRAVGAGDDVHLGLEPHSRHADGIADAFLRIDDVFLRQDVQDLLIGGNGDRLGGIDHAFDVALHHLLVLDGDDAVRIEAAHVAAGNSGVDRVDFASGHELRLFDRALNGLHRGLDVDHHALLQAARWMAADADDLQRPVGFVLADDGHHLARADVEAHDEIAVGTLSHRWVLRPAFGLRASRWRSRSNSACPRT